MFFKRYFIFPLLIFFSLFCPEPASAADNCTPVSDYTVSLDSTNSVYSNSGFLRRRDTDTYYVTTASAGTVTINIVSSADRVRFSYSQTSCPSAGDAPAAVSATYTFQSAADFNIKLYKAGRGGGGRSGNYTIEITFIPLKPIAEYRMDECSWNGTAGEVVDSSGNGLDGTAQNGASTLPGRVCMGGSFDGIDDSVLVPDSSLLDATEAITIMGWIKPEQLYQYNGANARGVLSKRVSDDSGEAYGIFFWNGQQMVDDDGDGDPDRAKLYIDIDGSNDRFSTDSYISKGVWTHFAVVYDGNRTPASRVEVYINGQLDKVGAESSSALPDYASDLYIGDLHAPNQSKVFKGMIDEVKIFNKALSAERVLEIYSNESAGRNFDGTSRTCSDCPQPPLYRNGTFNAVDYTPVCNAVQNWDDNITTKIAGSAYSLSILAKESATGLPMEANITRIDIYSFASGDTSQCSGAPYSVATLCSGGCGFTDAAGCLRADIPASLNGNAVKCAEIHIEGRDINSSASSNSNESNSSDNFAVRPMEILFIQPAADSNLTAERSYFFASGLTAVAADGATPVTDYNTTLTLQGVKYMRSGEANSSLAGTLNSAAPLFADGRADLNMSFSDVAILSMRLNDTSWAAVDGDDTPLSARRVYGERNVTFIPRRFDLQFLSTPVMENNDTSNRFTYLSSDLNMSAWLRSLTVVVTAVGERGGTMRNFSSPMDRLFADRVEITPVLRLPARHSQARYLYAPQPVSGADLGFDSGEAFINYADIPFNYDRSFDTPVDPFSVSGSEGNISVGVADALYPSVTGSLFSVFDGNATFYYGRLRAEDIATTDSSVTNRIGLEVYDGSASSFVSGFRQSSLRWFENAKHIGAASGRIRRADATLGSLLSSPVDSSIVMDYSLFGNGFIVMEINSSSALGRSRTIHLDIDPWLWYVPKGFGAAYSYSADSDCSMHPCFIYRYEVKGEGGGGVQSGDFNGSDFGVETIDLNATFERKQGVKLFR
ncbi:MSHA biogenesis protein MshQ [Hydrogenimonas sp.]|nr:MSHA biogenesis protein MshQ [Hydrogenimonas sp.]